MAASIAVSMRVRALPLLRVYKSRVCSSLKDGKIRYGVHHVWQQGKSNHESVGIQIQHGKSFPWIPNTSRKKKSTSLIKTSFSTDLSPLVGCRPLTTSVARWDESSEKPEERLPYHLEEPTEAELMQSIEYLQSEEYLEKYGDKPVWANYKRNHKGRLPPMKTRKRCIRGHGDKERVCGNPCPICRDSNLALHYKNVKLLEQFICPHSWNIYSTFRTGVCQRQFKKLCATIEKARQHGLLQYSVPFIEYNYEDYDQGRDADRKETPAKV